MPKKEKETLVSFLLDRTGSMQSIKDDVIGGFNQFIDEQAKQKGKCKFVFTLFDSQSIDVEQYDDVKDVPHLTPKTYVPRAGTPLLDAIGKTIHLVSEIKDAPKRVLFVVYTDGEENSSREYSHDAVRALVKEKEAAGWDFIFLGSDIDAYSEAMKSGFNAASTVSVTGQHTNSTFDRLSASTASYRSGDADYMGDLKREEQEQKKKGK